MFTLRIFEQRPDGERCIARQPGLQEQEARSWQYRVESQGYRATIEPDELEPEKEEEREQQRQRRRLRKPLPLLELIDPAQ